MQQMKNDCCQDCGETFVADGFLTGYGERDGKKYCYKCCNAHELREFSKAEKYSCYISTDGKTITTWPGGRLARVVSLSMHAGGFGGEYATVRAVADDGTEWHGRGGGPGCYVNLRRSRAGKRQRMKPQRFKAGQIVETTMGVRLTGTVSGRWFSCREWTDGTYREPQTPAERREAVPVVWNDGTRGWIFGRFLRLVGE